MVVITGGLSMQPTIAAGLLSEGCEGSCEGSIVGVVITIGGSGVIKVRVGGLLRQPTMVNLLVSSLGV